MKRKSSLLYSFYPLLFTFYPLLALLAQNIDQITPVTLLRPLIFSVAFSLVIWLVTSLLFRDLRKSALLTLAIQVLFFSYGPEAGLLASVPEVGSVLGSDRFLGLLDLCLLAGLTFWIIRSKSSLYGVSSFLTFTCLFLVAMPAFQIGRYYWVNQRATQATASQITSVPTPLDKPDIYFIILDAYSRQDLLKADFGFDNQPFINQLKALGFQVVPCSRSNYNATALSLSSMLNLNYETTLGVSASAVSSGEDPMVPLIKANQVHSILNQLGYNIYTFENEYPGLAWPGTNLIALPQQESRISKELLPIETVFIKNTGLNLLLDSQIGIFKQLKTTVNSPIAYHVSLEKFTLNKLPSTAFLPGPKFVYAHILLPHKPYVFDAQGNVRTDTRFFTNGDPINDDFFRQGYIGNLEFANSQIPQIMADILRYSQKPPIIILMGDHGYPWGDTHFENMMAVYLPGNNIKPFYPTITNVNVFRSILNDYFGANYPMLPDKSFRIDFNKGVYLPAPELQPDCINMAPK